MESEQKRLVLLAENVAIAEESQQNPVFLSIRFKLCDNAGNQNKEGVTAAFIQDLIANQEKYAALPFYADVKNLLARNYRSLGHMYNKQNGQFGSTQIGALVDFYSQENDGVLSLYATARVPKREKEICLRLAELYERDELSVSFEVKYNPKKVVMKDGIRFIDAADENALTGIALVSVPACIDAVALDMVAEVADSSDIVAESEELISERGEMEMPKEEVMQEEAVAEEAIESTAECKKEEEAEAAKKCQAEDLPAKEEEEDAEAAKKCQAEVELAKKCKAEDEPMPEEEKKDEEEDPAQDAQAELIEQTVEVRETIEKNPCDPNAPDIRIVDTHERYVETIEQKDRVIAELQSKIEELTAIAEKYNVILAEQEARILADKQSKAKAFAEKQGLDVSDTCVAEAIEKLDYEAIAEMVMRDAEPAKEEVASEIQIASFVDVSVVNKYGDMLKRRQ